MKYENFVAITWIYMFIIMKYWLYIVLRPIREFFARVGTPPLGTATK